MAKAAEYATWIVQNKSKQGTPEFDTVAQAYAVAKSNENGQEATAREAPPAASPGILDQLVGAGETALTLGTAATGGVFGTIGGGVSEALRQARAGQFGTPAAARAIEQGAAAGAQRFTYAPTTEAGQAQVGALGSLSELLPPVLPGALPVGMIGEATRLATPALQARGMQGLALVRQGAEQVGETAQRGTSIVRSMFGDRIPAAAAEGIRGRASIGAAGTPMELQRTTTAQGLPVPVSLTRGAATRDPAQLAFEKEQIRGPQGAPLRERAELNNLQVLNNFDAFIDQTGALTPATGMAATGSSVIDALSAGFKGAKAKTAAAYAKADTSPESLANVDLTTARALTRGDQSTSTSLFEYLNSKPTGVPSAAIPDTVKQYAVRLGIATTDADGNLIPANVVTVKQMESLRKEVNAATGIDLVDKRESSIIKSLIDATTEDVSGPLYKEARSLRERQARKYEGRAVVANLLQKVRGMDDPKVAASEAFNKSILNATPEEVTFLRRVLLTSGKDGQQAMRELQGATIKHLETVATSGLQTDSMGLPIVSPAKLNNAVNALDSNGRLDIILGKQKAQLVRDLNSILKDVQTVPPGTLINSSGTSMAIITALTEAGTMGALTGLPLPVLSVLKAAKNFSKDSKLKARISDALNNTKAAD